MFKGRRLDYLCRALSLVLGVLFLWAGIGKLLRTEDFVEVIAAIQIVPAYLLDLTATLVPLVEVLLGVSLTLGYRLRTAALCAVLLLLVFAGVIGLAMVKGIDTNCGCFVGFSAGKLGAFELWRNLVLTGLASLLAFAVGRSSAQFADSSSTNLHCVVALEEENR